MPKFNDSTYYPELTTARRLLQIGAIADPNEALDEDKTKWMYWETLMAFGAFAGLVKTVTASGAVNLEDTDYMLVEIDPDGSDRDVNLPVKGNDNHQYIIRHVGSANTLNIKRSGGASVGRMSAGDLLLVSPSTLHDFEALSGGGASVAENKITNGAMQIAQQGASAAGITASGYPVGGPDLIYLWMNDCGTVTFSQATDTFKDEGFANSLRVEWTTAKATLAADSMMAVERRFAGEDLQDFKKGLTDAEQMSVGFYVKANKTGTYIVELVDDDNARHAAKAYTIAASDTAQFVELALPADAAGELDNDDEKSFTLRIYLVAGTDYSSGTLATSWANETDANRAVGQVNLADSIGNYIEVTGFGLYIGGIVPEFEHQTTDDVLDGVLPELEQDKSAVVIIGSGFATTSTNARIAIRFIKPKKRDVDIAINNLGIMPTFLDVTAITNIFDTRDGVMLDLVTTGLTVGLPYWLYMKDSMSYLRADARLS